MWKLEEIRKGAKLESNSKIREVKENYAKKIGK